MIFSVRGRTEHVRPRSVFRGHLFAGLLTSLSRQIATTGSAHDRVRQRHPQHAAGLPVHDGPRPLLAAPRLQPADRLAGDHGERRLPTLYNRAIDADNEHDILVFLHDDVLIDDYFIGQRIIEGLKAFDVIGLAGTRRRLLGQHTWASVAEHGIEFDSKYLSGMLAHGTRPENFLVSPYGPAPAACELLDGVFLAARKSRPRAAGVRFDERFKFHFYDLDFCRTARHAGLRLGTWPIAVTHQSAGVFGSPSWHEAKAQYLDKWGD